MHSYKPFVDEALAIAASIAALGKARFTKKAARPLRRRCQAWLDKAPVDDCAELRRQWGFVVAGLVRAEDALLVGAKAIRTPQAPLELMQWLDWIALKTPGELFSASSRRIALYESVCCCAQALRAAPTYSATLHAVVSEHRWNAVPLLGLLGWCRDAHRGFRQRSASETRTWPEDAWVESLLAVVRHTSWCVPKNYAFHPLWAALAMYACPIMAKVNSRNRMILRWDEPDLVMEGLVIKLAACMPESAADALSFAQAHPELLSKAAGEAVMGLDIRQTLSTSGIFSWLRMYTQPGPEKEQFQKPLALKYPEMAATLKSYVDVIPAGQDIAFAWTLVPAWNQYVLGLEPAVEDIVSGDLFSS